LFRFFSLITRVDVSRLLVPLPLPAPLRYAKTDLPTADDGDDGRCELRVEHAYANAPTRTAVH